MDKPVKLSDILDAMEMQGEESPCYLDVETGRVVFLSEDIQSAAASDTAVEEMAEWMREGVTAARRIDAGETNFIGLPDRWDIDEYDMMRDFALSVEDADLSEELQDAITGTGAFRMFKSAIRRRGIDKQWYEFRDAAFKQVASDWCESHHLPCTED
jgi:hypothetical protein